MSHLRTSRAGRLSALVVTGLLGLAMTMMLGGFASTAHAADPVEVASNSLGTMTSTVDASVDGVPEYVVEATFTPLKFLKKNGRVFVRGVVDGTVTEGADSSDFTVLRTMKVKRINGEPARARSLRATCEILDLVIRPIDLNLLGLVIHLDRVHLNISAESGPGNLLGNLLCAVAGLLDGGLQGLLGRLVNLLNRILGQLGLGL